MSILGVYILLYGVCFKSQNTELLAYILNNIAKVGFSVAAIMKVYQIPDKQRDSREKILGVACGLCCILTILNFILFAQAKYLNQGYSQYIRMSWARSIYEVIVLIIGMGHLNTRWGYNRLPFLVGSAITMGIASFIPTILDRYVVEIDRNYSVDIGVTVFLIGMLIACSIRWERLPKDRRITRHSMCRWAFLSKLGSLILMGLGFVTGSIAIKVACISLELIMYGMIFSYIQQGEIITKWEEMNEDIIKREEVVAYHQIEQELLVSAAIELQGHIATMREKVGNVVERVKETDELRNVELANKIDRNSRRLMNMGNNILTLSNYESGRLNINIERVDLVSIVEEMVDSVSPYLTKQQISLEYGRKDKKLECELGVEAIERIIVNLISNSVKYSKAKGHIKVHVYREGDHARLTIEDNGAGIPKEQLDQVFTRFVRVNSEEDTKQEGSGLGLSIVKTLIELQKGNIRIYSELHKGTRVDISIPIQQV